MKKLLALYLFHFLACPAFQAVAQNTLVKMWDKTIGGNDDDTPACFQQTRDGGYIIGGHSVSDTSGDKTAYSRGLADYWIVKMDAMGTKQWDKAFGGANGDQLRSLQQTRDGGYILGGMSASSVGGDKTGAPWGNWDYWILKLDSLGTKVWDKTFGGTSTDQLTALRQTSDGGYILGGNSASGTGGTKSQPGRGGVDYWIVKTDSLGNMQWDRTFGGSDADLLYTVQQAADGGFILGGSSWSPAGGDKTAPCWGMDDYWVVKTDSLGNKQWDQDFGGNESDILYSLVQTGDDGYLLAGRSGSGISGNKTQPLWGGYDFWLVKTDAAGNKEWDKDFGGTGNEDEFGNISLTDDDGYLLAGTSYSPISGDKTESNLGQEQSWFIKLDSLFTKQWDKTVFTMCHDEIGIAIQTKEQCYAVISANGPSCGTGGYRTQSSWNNSRDYWIVKFCDSTYFPAAAATAVQNLCPGMCTSFLNLSTNSNSFQWSFPGATPDTSTSANPGNICYHTPGSYDVSLIAGNANGSDTLVLTNYITVFPQPSPQSILQSGDTLFANSGSAGYQWYLNGSLIPAATQNFYVASISGDYNVICTDLNGCEAEAVIYHVLAGLSEINKPDGIDVFPNPATGNIFIRAAQGIIGKITLADLPGRKIAEYMVKAPDAALILEGLECGSYLLTIETDRGVFSKKIMKQ